MCILETLLFFHFFVTCTIIVFNDLRIFLKILHANNRTLVDAYTFWMPQKSGRSKRSTLLLFLPDLTFKRDEEMRELIFLDLRKWDLLGLWHWRLEGFFSFAGWKDCLVPDWKARITCKRSAASSGTSWAKHWWGKYVIDYSSSFREWEPHREIQVTIVIEIKYM